MASANAIALLAILLALHHKTATSNFLSPLLSPIFDDVCKEVECGKGKCKSSPNSTFFFECECDPGWKQMNSDHDDHLKFLPCIVPNCTLDFACSKAPSPVQQEAPKTNSSIFDPCHWTDCGGGSCNKTSPVTYSCECAVGYSNLLNISALPCFRECAFGMDCANLGIPLSSRPISPPPALNDSSKNQAGLNPGGNLCWWMTVSMAIALWI